MHNVWPHVSLLHIKSYQIGTLESLHDLMMSIKAVNRRQNKIEFRQDSSSAAASSSSSVADNTS